MTGPVGEQSPQGKPLTAHDPRTVGPYRLLSRLGQGGQGIVYLGVDGGGQRVAVKMLTIDLQHNPKAKAQFAKEIAAASKVAPFCTAQILFADLDGELPYVVSEFIEGPTLYRQVHDHGPVAPNTLYRLAVGTATALAAIHQAGVVHCDFKPDNVILGADGPRVIDFGIARALGSDTVTSHVMGTVPYMAPERFHNVDVGPRCDVFAWAATIGYAAAGRAPFGHDSMGTVMTRVLHEPPDLSNLSGTLLALVTEGLSKDQYARPTAQQLLMRLLGHEAAPAAPLTDALREGSDAATTVLPVRPQPAQPQPTTQTASPVPTPVGGDTVNRPTNGKPAGSVATALMPTGNQPTTPKPDRPTKRQPEPALPLERQVSEPVVIETYAGRVGWWRRLRRQLGNAVGISVAIFLGAAGFAAGYVASTRAPVAAVLGGAAFAVVYLVRAVLAATLEPSTDHGRDS